MKPTRIPIPVINRVAKKHGLFAYFDDLGDYIHVPRKPNCPPTASYLAKLKAAVEELSALTNRKLKTTCAHYFCAYSEPYRLVFDNIIT